VRDQQRPLADRELRLGADREQPALVADQVLMSPAQLVQGRPLLPIQADVLARVFTDRAVVAIVLILHAAGHTDR
jgi:hypothetical protein